jgi:hypothetical protein
MPRPRPVGTSSHPREGGATLRPWIRPAVGRTPSRWPSPTRGEGPERWIVQDVMRGWTSRRPETNDLEGVVREIADLVKRYGLSTVMGDRYAAGWVRERFEADGIRYRDPEADTAQVFAGLRHARSHQRQCPADRHHRDHCSGDVHRQARLTAAQQFSRWRPPEIRVRAFPGPLVRTCAQPRGRSTIRAPTRDGGAGDQTGAPASWSRNPRQ